MKRLMAAVAFLVLVSIQIPALAHKNDVTLSETQETLDAYIAQQMEWGRVPGLALGIVREDGTAFIKGYGTAGNGAKVTGETVFPIASVSKVFTALAARQMINAGMLEEGTEVQAYLPGFSPMFQGQQAKVTVRQLLTHMSGIAKIKGGAPYLYGSDTTFEEIVERERNLTLVRQPGADYEYSNLNYLLLAAVMEAASGMMYEDYVRTHVLSPLEMEHTYLRADQIPQGQKTQGHIILYGLPVRTAYPEPSALLPTGGIYTDAGDMARLLSCYLANGSYHNNSILYPAGYGGDSPSVGSSHDIYWVPGIDAQRELFHDGSLPEGTSSIRIDRQSGYAVVVLANANDQDLFFSNGISAGTISQGLLQYLKTGTFPEQKAPVGAYERLAFPAAVFAGLFYYVASSTRRLLQKEKFPPAGLLVDGILPLLALTLIPVYHNISWGWLLAYHPELNSTILGCIGILLISFAVKGTLYVRKRKKRATIS